MVKDIEEMNNQAMSLIRKGSPILVFLFIFITPVTFYGAVFQARENYRSKYTNSFKSAEVFLEKGEYQDAIRKFREALDFADKLDYGEGKILCLVQLGLLYWNIGDLGESTNFYNNALSYAVTYGQTHYADECKKSLDIYRLYSEGKEYRSSGNYIGSIESFKKAIQLAKEIGSIAHEVKCLRQLGVSYWRANDLGKFFFHNKLALEIARYMKHKKEECQCLNNLGVYFWEKNEYSNALSRYIDSLRIAKNIENAFLESTCLNNIGLLYRSNGNFEEAIDYFGKALEIDEKIGNIEAIASDLINIGTAHTRKAILQKKRNDFHEAINFFKRCRRLAIEIGNKKVEARVLNNLGFVNLELKKYSESHEYLLRALDKALEINDLEAMGTVYCNLGSYYQKKKNVLKAQSFFVKAKSISKDINAAHILWEAYFGLGQCYEKTNDYQKAVENYESSINEIDNIRSRIVIDTFKAGFVRDKLHVYESLLDLLVRIDENSEDIKKRVFQIIERAKARAFLESVGESQFKIKEKLSLELRQSEIEIAEKISSIMRRLAEPNLSTVHRNAVQKEYLQAENEYMLLVSKMRSEIPEVANMILPEPCDLIQVQNRLLDEKTAVIEYFLGENQSYLFVIKKRNSHMFILPPRGEIRRSIKGLIKELSDPPRSDYRGLLASRRLFKELLPRIDEILPESIEHLIIVPDGVLYFLPFEALLSNSNAQLSASSYLIEKYRISYAPSCSSLLFLKDKDKKMRHKKALLAIGSPRYDLREPNENGEKNPSQILKDIYKNQGYDFFPLPYSKKEIKEIEKFFPKQLRDVYMDENAQEEVIKNTSLEDYQIIHFACHSLLNERSPFRSALVLALGSKEEDGFLLVREIYNLRLSADMIVLSACQTGRGRLENIEGVLGLPRIFFYCGARSVVSSLWKINDKSTTKFMSYFYKNLSKEQSKSEALRQAKINMIEGKYSHPFYWASFVLYGDGSSLRGIN
jgi:CHAT domain-containing protein/Tfp pilus assembly protein PilF